MEQRTTHLNTNTSTAQPPIELCLCYWNIFVLLFYKRALNMHSAKSSGTSLWLTQTSDSMTNQSTTPSSPFLRNSTEISCTWYKSTKFFWTGDSLPISKYSCTFQSTDLKIGVITELMVKCSAISSETNGRKNMRDFDTV